MSLVNSLFIARHDGRWLSLAEQTKYFPEKIIKSLGAAFVDRARLKESENERDAVIVRE